MFRPSDQAKLKEISRSQMRVALRLRSDDYRSGYMKSTASPTQPSSENGDRLQP
jgi:hypothetical protein